MVSDPSIILKSLNAADIQKINDEHNQSLAQTALINQNTQFGAQDQPYKLQALQQSNQTTDLDQISKRIGITGQLLQGVVDQPSYDKARATASQLLGPQAVASLPDQYDPRIVQQLMFANATADARLKAQLGYANIDQRYMFNGMQPQGGAGMAAPQTGATLGATTSQNPAANPAPVNASPLPPLPNGMTTGPTANNPGMTLNGPAPVTPNNAVAPVAPIQGGGASALPAVNVAQAAQAAPTASAALQGPASAFANAPGRDVNGYSVNPQTGQPVQDIGRESNQMYQNRLKAFQQGQENDPAHQEALDDAKARGTATGKNDADTKMDAAAASNASERVVSALDGIDALVKSGQLPQDTAGFSAARQAWLSQNAGAVLSPDMQKQANAYNQFRQLNEVAVVQGLQALGQSGVRTNQSVDKIINNGYAIPEGASPQAILDLTANLRNEVKNTAISAQNVHNTVVNQPQQPLLPALGANNSITSKPVTKWVIQNGKLVKG